MRHLMLDKLLGLKHQCPTEPNAKSLFYDMTKFEMLMAIHYVVWFMTLGNYLCVSVKHSRDFPFVFGHPSPSRRSVCQLAEHFVNHIHTFHHSTKENVMLNAEEALLLLPFSNFRDYCPPLN
jgi:hypothetical protein